ncbi:glycine--tRNA ligase [Candidatus Saccharibacteria bacterium]|nr:glycine--tRNA ligase [Candidatus Saccharibacteria bacterium]
MSKVSLDDIVSLAKRRGFIYQGSEIYGGLAGTWDYGPLGTQLKRNIANLWWKMFVEDPADMYGLDAAILMPKKVFEASGHLAGFKDPMVVCNNCHSQFRADQIDTKKCPTCGKSSTFGKPRQFNMMLGTQLGAVEGKGQAAYLRPETAQGIFTNFNNVVDSFYPDLPFGIAQVGRAFRNEISPRDFTFRAREFEQLEIEYFVKPQDWQKTYEAWVKKIYQFLQMIGLPKNLIHELEVPAKERAHYSQRTIDFEFDFPFGRAELLGLAYRTDYDLANHQKVSGKTMEYRPKDGNKPFTPHVIEPSFGLDRLVLAILTATYAEDKQKNEKRLLLKLPANIAPVQVAVFPLLKNKPALSKKAKQVYDLLKKNPPAGGGAVMWDDNGNIGKRYRRQDEIGTPHCVTIDFQTLEDDTVTVRDRDTTKQKRIKIAELGEHF